MKKIFFLIVSFLPILALASVEPLDGRESGGGDARIAEFFSFVRVFESIGEKSPDLLPERLGNELAKISALLPALVVESSITPLFLNGERKDAINYPQEKKIVFHGYTWDQLSPQNKARLVIHEMLGLLRIEDGKQYAVTDEILSRSKPKWRVVLAVFVSRQSDAPAYKKSTCSALHEIYDTKKRKFLQQKSLTSDNSHISWRDGLKFFSVADYEDTNTDGTKLYNVSQNFEDTLEHKSNDTRLIDRRFRFYRIDDKVTQTDSNYRMEIQDLVDGSIMKDITHADPKRNQANTYISTREGADGVTDQIFDVRTPDAPDSDGMQFMSGRNTCKLWFVPQEGLKSKRLSAIKAKTDRFSTIHKETMQAKKNWQDCLAQFPEAGCTEKQDAYKHLDNVRAQMWNSLLEPKDFRSLLPRPAPRPTPAPAPEPVPGNGGLTDDCSPRNGRRPNYGPNGQCWWGPGRPNFPPGR